MVNKINKLLLSGMKPSFEIMYQIMVRQNYGNCWFDTGFTWKRRSFVFLL